MPWLILIDFAPITSHSRFVDSPDLIEDGLALKVVITGALDILTVMVADAVELPAPLEAVSLYTVVEAGDTLFVPVNDTVPTSGLMETDVAPATLHDNVAVWPVVILSGAELKLLMAGSMPVTVTVTVLLADPDILLANSV